MTTPSEPRVPPASPLADEAVLLRLPRADDAPAIAAACADPEITRWVPVPVPYTLADARAFVEGVSDGWASGLDLVFVIEDRASGRLAGMIGLHRGAPARRAIGYWLAPRARGRGLATRAVRLVAAWAFEDPGLERLELMTLVGNEASGHVALRAGFRREGILRRHLPFRGRSVDAVMHAMVRGEAAPEEAERLGSPGPPAAGRADELDRPAAAVRRSAGRLADALEEWDRASAAVGALAGTGGPAAAPLAAELLDTLREEVARRAVDPPPLTRPDAADRRDAVAALLGALGIPDPLEPAASLVALGWDGNELDDLLAPFGTDEARLVVATWLAASARVRQLLAEVTNAAAQIGTIVAASRA
ncbi:MAG TPA: GNAT family protein [Candidatus Nanopelagicales bacterium]|nr:GNAT family protein [Candidatus Nanopelagicales bacterium]